jgi:hypothetical protein
MKVKVTKSELIDVEISKLQMQIISIEYLYNMIGLNTPRYPNLYFINSDTNKLCSSYEESGGSHSWFEEEIIRDATELDRKILVAINCVKNYKEDK